jgi:outer membrane protein assembly factor BamD (BamD/ComL family)
LKRYFSIIIVFVLALIISSCATKKSRNDVSGFKKFYHNTTAKFNGYFNADVLLDESILKLEESHEDNYNQLLALYKYSAVDDPKGVAGDLDKAIEKVSIVATLHSPSNWVDDCYVLMGKAQYLKQDFESAEETLEYFAEEFDPKNASLRKKKNKSKDDIRKEKEEKRKEERKIKEEEQEEKIEQREEEKKQREQAQKDKKKLAKEKQKERERKNKERKKNAKKNRKNKDRTRTTTPKKEDDKTVDKTGENQEQTTTVDKNKEASSEKPAAPIVSKPKVKEEDKSEEETENSKKETKNAINESANEGGFFKRKPAYQDGLLWLAKTYIERERWAAASYMLNKLEGLDLIDYIAEQLPVAQAYYHLKQMEYDKTMPYLETAIEVTKDKHVRARYAFILGQLRMMSNQEDKAYANFEQVIKWKPGYEMEFHARMNMAKNAWASGNESTESVLKKLGRMLNEDKNADYKGEIYYTIADIKLKQNDKAGAIENLEKSIHFNTGNTAQKTESYYTLAKLYYGNEEYVNSKFYFDSTLIVMKEVDLRIPEVRNFSENLADIAANIQIIEVQDSLLKISALSSDEKKALAQKIKDEQQAKKDEASNVIESATIGKSSNTRVAGSKPSNFFAYNQISLQKGAQDFVKKWGSIRIEDDWRRSNKSTSSDLEDEDEEVAVEEIDITAAELKAILKGVPNNPAEIDKANQMIKNAMFDLGVLYRDRLKNYTKSVDILEQLLVRYPNSDKELESYYYLYLGYLDLNNTSKANFYKDQVIKKFPNSIYAQSLTDPNFAANYRKEEKKIEDHYNQSYEYFDAGEFAMAFENIQKTEELFGKEFDLKPKFALLNAMCIGNINGKDAYIDELRNVIARFPNTAEQTRAKEIMRFLRGDKQVFNKVDESAAKSEFSIQDDKLHYAVIVMYSSDESQINTSKISISNFNKNHFNDKRLKISGIPLSNADESNIILVRKFSNREDAMNYYKKVSEIPTEFVSEDIEYETFVVTQKNYREIIKQRSVNSYRIFFESHYLQ